MIFFKKKLPPAINPAKRNILEARPPYYVFSTRVKKAARDAGESWVIFWGANFRDLPNTNEEEFVRQTNLCLDFIRRECAGCRLIYKPHPAETDEEIALLDLNNFEITKERTVGEFFMFKNYDKIKYVFSVCSGASMSATNLGLNSYLFLPLFKNALDVTAFDGYRVRFESMPADSFIFDLGGGLKENKKILPSDPELVGNLSKILSEKKGMAWFMIGDPGLLTLSLALAGLIRNISSGRKFGLIIEKHHRWEGMNINEVSEYFDEVVIYPRLFYSLRPVKIWNQLKTAIAISKFKISEDDILFGLSYTSFIENCFVSYFPKNFKIAVFLKDAFKMCYGPKDEDSFKRYFSRRAAVFANAVLQPLLGLNKTIFLEDPARIANFDRYQRPVNDVYDQIYVF